jgi:hypothetical protein
MGTWLKETNLRTHMTSSYLDLNLHLKEIRDLFVDPELDPFENKCLQTSGVEEALNYLRMKRKITDRIRMNIFLPRDQIDHDTQSKTVEALARFCDFKILQNQKQLVIGQAEGRRSIMIGLGFFALCGLLVFLIRFFSIMESQTGLIISIGFFTILIWMAIWNPAETFLYGLQPYKLEIRNYQALKNAKIMIEEET